MAEIFDAQFHHPFTCIVAGPTRSGKSTFVFNLIVNQHKLIDVEFDYITIIIGTNASDNSTLCNLVKHFPEKVKIIELKKDYSTPLDLKTEFQSDFEEYIKEQTNKNGCIIFDDLMAELADSDVVLNLFTKYSSHSKISSIFITQNIFSKGKRGDNVTIYRNTHALVLFKSPMDNATIRIIAQRLKPRNTQDCVDMLAYILNKHRYVVIHGDQNRSDHIRFATDIFAEEPFPHQRIFELTHS